MPNVAIDQFIRTMVIIEIIKGNEKVKLESPEYEYEANIVASSRKKVLSSGPLNGKPYLLNGMYFYAIWYFEDFDKLMGINTTENFPAQFEITINQYKLPPTIGTNDIQIRCASIKYN